MPETVVLISKFTVKLAALATDFVAGSTYKLVVPVAMTGGAFIAKNPVTRTKTRHNNINLLFYKK